MTDTGEIWLTFSNNLRAFVLHKVADIAVAEDILQELFERIHLKIDTLRDKDKLKPWLYQIARNLIADHYRRTNRINDNVQAEIEIMHPEENEDIMDTAVKDMIGMMDKLPPEYCEALCLTEIEGMSQAEYARKAGIPYSSAKSRVQRSRKLLRDMLMRCCHYQYDKYGTVLSITPKHCCCCNPE